MVYFLSMDIEDLNNSQLILLSLFVSFITAMASSIIASSLLYEATPAQTRTINQIIERTVEREVPQVVVTQKQPEYPVYNISGEKIYDISEQIKRVERASIPLSNSEGELTENETALFAGGHLFYEKSFSDTHTVVYNDTVLSTTPIAEINDLVVERVLQEDIEPPLNIEKVTLGMGVFSLSHNEDSTERVLSYGIIQTIDTEKQSVTVSYDIGDIPLGTGIFSLRSGNLIGVVVTTDKQARIYPVGRYE